jgi:hypothetical protein
MRTQTPYVVKYLIDALVSRREAWYIEVGRCVHTVRASAWVTEAMTSTRVQGQKRGGRDESDGTACDNSRCSGSNGESLPCFACSDPDRTYTESDT